MSFEGGKDEVLIVLKLLSAFFWLFVLPVFGQAEPLEKRASSEYKIARIEHKSDCVPECSLGAAVSMSVLVSGAGFSITVASLVARY